MRARKSQTGGSARRARVRERILGAIGSPYDEALVFAASSVMREITAARYTGEVVERAVRTERGAYTLRGSRVAGRDGAQPVVLIYAEPDAAAGPPLLEPDEVRARFGMTRKEAQVALLLARHYSNEQIAKELWISQHTARHHTESVLSKLRVRSRRGVPSALSYCASVARERPSRGSSADPE